MSLLTQTLLVLAVLGLWLGFVAATALRVRAMLKQPDWRDNLFSFDFGKTLAFRSRASETLRRLENVTGLGRFADRLLQIGSGLLVLAAASAFYDYLSRD